MPKMTPMRRIMPLACGVWMLAVFFAAPRAAQVTQPAEGGAGKPRHMDL